MKTPTNDQNPPGGDPSRRLSSLAIKLRSLFRDYLDGTETDSSLADKAEALFIEAGPSHQNDCAAAYWAGRIEEATGRDVYPDDVGALDADEEE